MNKYFISAFLSIALTSCWILTPSKTVVGSGVSVKRPLMFMWKDKKPFDTLSVSGIGTVQFVQGDGESIAIEADENIHEYIDVKMDDNVLEIRIKDNVHLRPKTPIVYSISFKTVKEVELAGSVLFKAPLITSEKLEVALSGATRFDATINAKKLEVEMAGASKMNVEGTVEKQELEIAGAAIYNAGKLRSKKAEIEAAGSSRVTVAVKNHLEVEGAGVAMVLYTGNPTLDVNKAGSATVQKVG